MEPEWNVGFLTVVSAVIAIREPATRLHVHEENAVQVDVLEYLCGVADDHHSGPLARTDRRKGPQIKITVSA